MKLSRLFPLLALLLAASLHAENTHKEVRIASPWPAQNTIIAMLGYGDNIVGTSMIAKRIPLFRQSLPRIEKVAAVSVNSGHEINPEQIIALGVDMLFVPQNMVVPQQALLKQAGVQVLAFEANSLRALTQRVQQTAAVLGPDAQQKALAYQRYFDRNVALVTGRLK
ncbi:ABC transporter substrate-binding protein, partial [Escherichia coli]